MPQGAEGGHGVNWQAIEAIGQIVGIIVAALAIWWGLRGVRRQMWLSTFFDYTKRYAEIIDRLPPSVRVPGDFLKLSDLPPPERERILSALRQYFNLCSEEHYLAEQRVLDRKTWGIWSTGIKDAFRNSVFRDGWALVLVEYEMYPEFCTFMDQLGGRAKAPEAPVHVPAPGV